MNGVIGAHNLHNASNTSYVVKYTLFLDSVNSLSQKRLRFPLIYQLDKSSFKNGTIALAALFKSYSWYASFTFLIKLLSLESNHLSINSLSLTGISYSLGSILSALAYISKNEYAFFNVEIYFE